ncbi:hypothetical protein L7F22_019971 [Adiantum nelumboides]|nr:hypothetical protein [Adiantum nelumboides]
MVLHDALRNGFLSEKDACGLQTIEAFPSSRQHMLFPWPSSTTTAPNSVVRPINLLGFMHVGFNPTFEHPSSPGMQPPSYASTVLRPPITGAYPLLRPAYSDEALSGKLPFLGKYPASGSNLCFNNVEKPHEQDCQQMSPKYPQQDSEAPHQPINPGNVQTQNACSDAVLDGVIIHVNELEYWYSQLEQRMVIGLCHGIRPSLESLKSWVGQQWTNKNLRVEQIQYLPNNYYMFLFEDPTSALQVVGLGQWIIRNTPLTVFNWYLGFKSRGPKPTKIPTWVDLPIELYPWLKSIGTWVGRVLGQRTRGGFSPKWDPQLLIEVDIIKDLKSEVPIKDSNGVILHCQKITYKNLPNACFHCFKQGHFIKDFPDLKPAENQDNKAPDKEEGFETVTRRNSSRNGKNPRQSPHSNKHYYSPLLENVFEPFSQVNEDLNENLFPQEDLPGPHEEKEEDNPPATHHLSAVQPDQDPIPKENLAPDSPMDRTRGTCSSLESEDEAIPNTQKPDLQLQPSPSFEEQLALHNAEQREADQEEEGMALVLPTNAPMAHRGQGNQDQQELLIRITHQLEDLSVHLVQGGRGPPPNQEQARGPRRQAQEYHCYNCGENGHGMYYCLHPRRIGNFRGPRNQVSPPRERRQQQPPFPIQQAPPVQILRPPVQSKPQQPPPPPPPIAPIPPLPIPEKRAINVISLDAKVKVEEEEKGKSFPKNKEKAKVEDVDAMPIKRARQEEVAMSETGERRKSKENGKSSSKKK